MSYRSLQEIIISFVHPYSLRGGDTDACSICNADGTVKGVGNLTLPQLLTAVADPTALNNILMQWPVEARASGVLLPCPRKLFEQGVSRRFKALRGSQRPRLNVWQLFGSPF